MSLSKNEESVSLTVSDNGIGFQQKQSPEGVGLRNISSRVESLQGKWQVESNPTSGTKVTVEVPV
jgi:signal transduction histidine kinase